MAIRDHHEDPPMVSPGPAVAVEKLARSLGFSCTEIDGHRIVLPDGSPSFTREFRAQLFTKAAIERFCPTFAPAGVLVHVADPQWISTRESLAQLGISLDDAAGLPDIVIHSASEKRLLLIDLPIDSEPINDSRRLELLDRFTGTKAHLVLVSAFESRASLGQCEAPITWGTVIWAAEEPDHLIHYDPPCVAGPYPGHGNS